ncbi:MAG: DUF4951 domain-containing protein [Chloroflexota bacterium]
MNGSEGYMTGSAGASCSLAVGANQLTNPATGRFWDAPSWALTGKFRATALDWSFLRIRVATQLNQYTVAGLSMQFGGGGSGSGISVGAPQVSYPFVAGTTYNFKWVVVWNDQTRVRVWPVGAAEPTDWQATASVGDKAPASEPSPFMIDWRSTFGSTSIFMDDLASGPAPILPKLPPPPGTEHNPPYTAEAETGDPVNTFTGSLAMADLDVSIPGRGPALSFARSYNSNDPRVTALGPGWTHSYATRLVDPDDGTQDVILIGPQGRSDRYVWTAGAFVAPAGVDRALVRNADLSYTATDKAQTVWLFDPSGVLVQLRDRYGNVSNLGYNTAGQLATIGDPAGRGTLTLAYADGRITSVTDWAAPARVVGYQYDANGRLWKVTDREGQVTTYGYEGSSHRLTTVVDRRGNTAMTNTYDAQGRVATQKDALGLSTGTAISWAYQTNPDGTRVTMTTAPATSLESSFQPTVQDTYDAKGQLVQRITTPSTSDTLTQSFTYDAAGNLTSATDPRGAQTDFCYDVNYGGAPVAGSSNNLTRVISPAPSGGAPRPTTLIAYDAKANLIQSVRPRGVPSSSVVTCSTDLSGVIPAHATDYAYDATGVFLLSVTTRHTDPEFGLRTAVTKFEYADAANPGLVTRSVPPRGNTSASPDYTYATSYTYFTSGNRRGMLQDVTDALGNRTSFDYDPVGRKIAVVNPLGNVAGATALHYTTTTSYDKEDRVRFVNRPAPLAGGAQLIDETRYDQAGNAVVRVDANGQVSTFAYDDRGSLAQVKESPNAWTDPASPPSGVIVTEYTYDAGGNPTRVTRAKGDAASERVVDYVYDGRGLPRRETQYPSWPATSPALVTTFAYDDNGNQVSLVDPLGDTTTIGYDMLGRRTSIDYSDVGTPDVALAYDRDGQRTQMVDGTGTTTYAWDEAGQLLTVNSPGPLVVGNRYDRDGHRIKAIYPDATSVSYLYDKAGRMTSLTDWASRSVTYTYWQDGLVKTAVQPDNSTASYAYDNARRIRDVLYTTAAGQFIDRAAYTLDAVGNVVRVRTGALPPQFARPDGFAGATGTWTGTFASINEVVADDSTFIASPSGGGLSSYEVSLADPATPVDLIGTTLRYRYAKSGNNNGQTMNLLVELRQGAGTVVASQTHNNIPGASGSGWQAGSLALTPAQAGTISNTADLRVRFTSTTTGGGQARKTQVSWAELEVPAAIDPATTSTYVYDRISRLTGATDASGGRTFTYDPAGNRLTRTIGPTTAYTYDRADRMTAAGPQTVTVDASGSLVARGADTFAYDQAQRLITATVGGATETFAYDGDGTRITRQVGVATPIQYTIDRSSAIATVLADGTRKYVYGLELAYAVSGTGIEIYRTDGLGTVRSLANAAGTTTATFTTDEWGRPTGGTGSSTQPFGFTGEQRDGTGLVHLRSRYYDPELGRFLTRDSWPGVPGLGQTHNRYAYTGNNPTSRTDPTGHVWDTALDAAFIVYDVGSLVFGPEKEREANWLALAADTAGLFIPFVTGAGLAARAGFHAADEATGAIRWLDESAAAACSFAADTMVATPDGPVPISEIEVGDIVLAWDEATDSIVERAVTAVLPHPDDGIARLTIDGETITTTPDHPFLTVDRGWVEAGDLRPGDWVRQVAGAGVVDSITTEPYAGILWDLTVDGAHTFAIGTGGWVVHNCPSAARFPGPPTPGGMSNAQFGQVIGWGTGDAAARAQISQLSREGLTQAGVTREMAEAWADFYRNEAIRVPSNPSARGRADLMTAVADLLR